MSRFLANGRSGASADASDVVVIPHAGSPARGATAWCPFGVVTSITACCERGDVGLRAGGKEESQPLEVKYV